MQDNKKLTYGIYLPLTITEVLKHLEITHKEITTKHVSTEIIKVYNLELKKYEIKPFYERVRKALNKLTELNIIQADYRLSAKKTNYKIYKLKK